MSLLQAVDAVAGRTSTGRKSSQRTWILCTSRIPQSFGRLLLLTAW